MRNLGILALLIASCGHTKKLQPDPVVVICSKCVAKQRSKDYHLERFEKLCLTLDYAQHLVANPNVKKNIQDALRACAWIYSGK